MALHIAERKRRRNGEPGPIEPPVGSSVGQFGFAHYVSAQVPPVDVVGSRVACIGKVTGNPDMVVLPGGELQDAVKLPRSKNVVEDFVAGLELAAGSSGYFVDPACREDVRHVECRGTPVVVKLVGILRIAPVLVEPARAVVVRLAPGVGNQVRKARRVPALELELEGAVSGSTPTPVEEGRRDVRERPSQGGITGTRCEGGIVHAPDAKIDSTRSNVSQIHQGIGGELILKA